MAVLDKIPGIEVTVQINGQDVVEYDDPDASELDKSCPTSSKYIESIDDAEFTIQYKVTNEYRWGYKKHRLSFIPSVDGFPISGRLFSEDKPVSGCHIAQTTGATYTDAETRQTHLRKCRFSTISTGMSDAPHQSAVYLPSY